jgi:Virulence factor BrkB
VRCSPEPAIATVAWQKTEVAACHLREGDGSPLPWPHTRACPTSPGVMFFQVPWSPHCCSTSASSRSVWYIGTQALESTYGAAASIVILLIWVYYSAQIVLFGAELTHAYSTEIGSRRAVDVNVELPHNAVV